MMYCVMAVWTEAHSRSEFDFMTMLGVHQYLVVTSETEMTFGNEVMMILNISVNISSAFSMSL